MMWNAGRYLDIYQTGEFSDDSECKVSYVGSDGNYGDVMCGEVMCGDDGGVSITE